MTRDGNRVWVELGDLELSGELTTWLATVGARNVSRAEQRGIDPVLMPIIVTFVIVGAGMLTRFLTWLRAQRRCLLIIDARGATITVRVDCRERHGRTVVVAHDGTNVEILEAPELLDLNEVAVTAVTHGAEAAIRVAEQSGAIARAGER